jgi:hypothetical protein
MISLFLAASIEPMKEINNHITMKIRNIILMLMCFSMTSFAQTPRVTPEAVTISETTISQVTSELVVLHGQPFADRIQRGVKQAANLWRESDGTPEEFSAFCRKHFIAQEADLKMLFDKLMVNFEVLNGNMLRVKKDLMRPLHLDGGPIQPVDIMFGSYEPGAHLTDDMFGNKIAFMVILNFPFLPLEEKNTLGAGWTRQEWAYARVGDYFTSRLPAQIGQETSFERTAAGNYIAEYNIYMGKLTDSKGKTLFPADLRLISHWGLRDELKSNYAEKKGIDKQRMIYAVMKRIIDQSIPAEVINNPAYLWNPANNTLMQDGKNVSFLPEPDTRYEYLLRNFRANLKADPYYPSHPTFIQRQFEAGMEIPQEEIRELFIALLSSPQVKEVATLISKRLGRPLEPFDIWYNGFRSKSTYTEEELDSILSSRYPDVNAFQNDLSPMLVKLGFSADKAAFLASHILVEGSRGAGHAYGSLIRDDRVLLRTRIGAGGMNYKGYNIAVHEFGHNVEQVITLHDVDYYSLNRVPNTAFTEALAFIFQKRDLELLGLHDDDPLKEHMATLTNFWSCYEIMGVALVDMQVWEWMYAHPEATPAQLKEAVIRIAKEVWNAYYAPVFGTKDEPILAIYSHMISNPLYLANYPLGQLIDFQIGQHLAGKDFAGEIQRMFELGRLTPQTWMQQAVGTGLSVQPILEATTAAIAAVRKN